MAMFMRIGLLLVLAWLAGLVEPLFTIVGQELSGRDLILIAGGLFLIWKSTGEIHQSMEGEHEDASAGAKAKAAFSAVIIQIMVVDLVFSLDSIITAVGMVDDLRGDDRRGHRLGGPDDGVRRRDRALRLRPSDDQDAGAVVPRRSSAWC